VPNEIGVETAPPAAGDPWAMHQPMTMTMDLGESADLAEALSGGTLVFGIEPEHSTQITLIDAAFSTWVVTSLDETAVANRHLRGVLDGFRTSALRPTRIGRRYASAAEELKTMLHPEMSITSIAEMCGVSDRGFRDWLKGAGVREKRSRRLMTVRAVVKALLVTHGRDRAIQWLQLPHHNLGGQTPAETLKQGQDQRVLELAVTSARGRRSHSIVPANENPEHELSGEEILAARGQLESVEILDLL
jgi:uncharacterized protein (DUF2384 family)